MEQLNNIKAVLFDLDGTLYIDRAVWRSLVRLFVAGTPYEPLLAQLLDECEQVLRGQARLRLGQFVQLDAVGGQSLLDVPTVPGLAQANVHDYFDRKKYSFIGETWTLAMYIGKKMPYDSAEFWRRFRIGRSELFQGPNAIAPNPRLLSALRALHEKDIVTLLCTNTEYFSANPLLSHLQLQGCFNELVQGAFKPMGLYPRIQLLMQNYDLAPDQILLVGDQGYNDLFPGYELGTRTLRLNPYHVEDGINWTQSVQSMDEMIDCLEGL